MAEVTYDHGGAALEIGDRCYIHPTCIFHVAVGITIGDDVLIARECLLMDHSMHSLLWNERAQDLTSMQASLEKDWRGIHREEITIEDKAWLGARCIILPGSQIGEGAVLGAGTVVRHQKIPPYQLWVGNPARKVKALKHPATERKAKR